MILDQRRSLLKQARARLRLFGSEIGRSHNVSHFDHQQAMRDCQATVSEFQPVFKIRHRQNNALKVLKHRLLWLISYMLCLSAVTPTQVFEPH